MTITSTTGAQLNFLETGVDGIYVLDHAVFKDRFDEDGHNKWKTSSGKKKLQEWAERTLPQEILEQFDIDLPTVEEVFSQKMIDWRDGEYVKDLVSKQFPIFKDSDERMKEFESKPTWWWTRSAIAGSAGNVWGVHPGGDLYGYSARNTYGFVPVLRKKKDHNESEAECWERFKKVAEEYAQKHMHPHKTIIITQQGIELFEGEKASPFEILD